MKYVAILGSTGSIGRQALDVVRLHRDKFALKALVAHQNVSLIAAQANEFHPEIVFMTDPKCEDALKPLLPNDVKLICAPDAAIEAAALDGVDTIVHGISGIAGLAPLLAALKANKLVALANKESIVCGGEVVKAAARASLGRIFPVDSEQAAIFQCLSMGLSKDVKRLILTASGGPFYGMDDEHLANVTPEMALAHPTWSMGRKITIDSASMFNKGLEVIEASYLFDVDGDSIDVLIHRQSIVHSLVEFADGAVAAQLSVPDMRIAIQLALTYPERFESGAATLDLDAIGGLSFDRAKRSAGGALDLAYIALKCGKGMPIVYNGANEVAVELFLQGKIPFLEIQRCVERCMGKINVVAPKTVGDILEIDGLARRVARQIER